MSELGDGSVESLNIGRDEEVPTTGDSNVTTRAQRAEQEDMRHEDLENDGLGEYEAVGDAAPPTKPPSVEEPSPEDKSGAGSDKKEEAALEPHDDSHDEGADDTASENKALREEVLRMSRMIDSS